MRRSLAHLFRALLWTAVVLLAVWVALIKGPMFLTRWRMQRLLADFHSIYPTQSSWSDAQRIITHWHHWGYARGPCTSVDCDYTIVVSDPIWRQIDRHWPENLRGNTFRLVLKSFFFLGWRGTDFYLRLVVEDNSIVRTRTTLTLTAPEDIGEFILVSQVRTRLRASDAQNRLDAEKRRDEPWILGRDEQLDEHPDYKVGRPGGCEICERADVTYTPTLEHPELIRLTRYDLSCLTGFRSCAQIYDVLPAARDWHLYDGDHMGPKTSGGPGPIPCLTEPRALGRDAEMILEVEPIHLEQKVDTTWSDHPLKYDVAEAKLIRVLKGTVHGADHGFIFIEPYFGAEQEIPPQLPEALIPGRRALVLLEESSGYEPDGRFVARRCGVLEDTPTNLSALKVGMAQDITVRHPIAY